MFLARPNPNIVRKVEYFLLCLTPLAKETNSNGQNQFRTILQSLNRIGLTFADILLIVADNTNVNPKIARIAERPFLGCKAHILALAVKQFLSRWTKDKPKSDNLLLDDVNKLMKKLKSGNLRGELRKTNLLKYSTL